MKCQEPPGALRVLRTCPVQFQCASHPSPRPRTRPQWERTENGQLLSVHDVADLLQVPVSWVYGHTRDRCPDRIPGFRLGKYWRFDETDVLAWIQRRRLVVRRNSCVSEYNGTR